MADLTELLCRAMIANVSRQCLATKCGAELKGALGSRNHGMRCGDCPIDDANKLCDELQKRAEAKEKVG